MQVDAHPAFTQPLAIPHAQQSLSDFSQRLALLTTISPKDAASPPFEAASTSAHETEQLFDLTETLAFQIAQILPPAPVITPLELIFTAASAALLDPQDALHSAPIHLETAHPENTKTTAQSSSISPSLLNLNTPVAPQPNTQSLQSLADPIVTQAPEHAQLRVPTPSSATVSTLILNTDAQGTASQHQTAPAQKTTLNDADITNPITTISALNALASTTQTISPPTPTPPLMSHQLTTLPSVQLATASLLSAEITRSVSNGTSTFTIRLDPPELGRLDVRLEMNDTGNIVARIAVEKAETLDFLFRDQRGFERSLTQAGFNADQTQLEFSLSMQDFTRNTPRDPNQSTATSKSQTDALTLETAPSNAHLQTRYSASNTSSHLDIHV